MKKEELIIGKTYRVKSKEWFDANKNSDNKVVEDEVEFDRWELCGKSFTLVEFGESYYYRNKVEIGKKGEDGFWKDYYVPVFALEEDPNDTRKASQATHDFIDKIRAEKFIYGYDGGPGGGTGGPINTETNIMAPAFTQAGEEGVYLKVSGLRRTFTIKSLTQLFEKGETSQSFKFSEWTTITTQLKLIEDKTKLPGHSSWSTMRD